MSTLSGGFATTAGPRRTKPGLPCVHCGKEVNVAPYGWARAGKAKVVPKPKKGEPKRRPNPVAKLLISRVVCSTCHNKGLE